jgi:excisionase family DNA binding protein
MLGKSTGRGNSWTSNRVCSLRQHQGIATYREGKRAERGEVTTKEAAAALSVSSSTIWRMVREGALPAEQLCKGAPWIIRSQDLDRDDVRREAKGRRSRPPLSNDPRQEKLDFIRRQCPWVVRDILVESRKVEIAGITTHPSEQWTRQMARNVIMQGNGALRDNRSPSRSRHQVHSFFPGNH